MEKDKSFTHSRRSIRLKHYDYALPGGYFITLCSYRWKYSFGEITEGVMHLNENGRIVQEEWLRSPLIRPEVELDAFVVMPNHAHGVIIFHDIDSECAADS